MNCYLVRADAGYILIDTGMHANRTDLIRDLEAAGCRPGSLRLIIVTHGDLDHIGNCAYLRQRYGAKIAIHRGELAAAESANMASNRTGQQGAIARFVFPLIALFSRSDRFTSDLYVEDGFDLSGYGLDARVLHLPGHSRGSIGVLTKAGELFCGDLLQNIEKPAPTELVDDPADLSASIERVKQMEIGMVYPGHGNPFHMEQLSK